MNKLSTYSHHYFKIKEKVFIITPQNEKESRNVNKALTFLAKDKWTKTMEEKNGVYEIKRSVGIG